MGFIIGLNLIRGDHYLAAHLHTHDFLTQQTFFNIGAQVGHTAFLPGQLLLELLFCQMVGLHYFGNFFVHFGRRNTDLKALGLLRDKDVHDHQIQHLMQHSIHGLGLFGIIGIESGAGQVRQCVLLQVKHGDDLPVDHGRHLVELGGPGHARNRKPGNQQQNKCFFHDVFSLGADYL